MSYLSELREKNPQLEDISDADIIPYLPQIDPQIFTGKSQEEIHSIATQDNNWLADTGRLMWSATKESAGQALTAIELATDSDWDVDDQLIKSGKDTYNNVDVGVRQKIEKAGFQEESDNSITGVLGAGAKSLGSMPLYVAATAAGVAAAPFTEGASVIAAPAAMNSAVIAGSNYHQVKDQIEAMNQQQLSTSEYFKSYLVRANKFAEGEMAFLMARKQMAADLATDAAKDGAIIGGISGAVLGPALSKMFRGGQGALSGAKNGILAEGGQEFFEEGSQSLESEQAKSKITGEDVNYERAARDGLFGMVLGSGVGGAVGATTGAINRAPLDTAQERINEAGEEVAAAGGDALDQATARGQTQATETPSAVQEGQQQKTNNRDMSGIEGMIISARRLGFAEEEVRLTNAKNLYARALAYQQQGNVETALQLRTKADLIVQDVVAVNEPLAKATDDAFPIPYTFQGEVDEISINNQLSVQEQQTQDAPNVYDGAPAVKLEDNQRLSLQDGNIIYGAEPDYSVAARKKAQAQSEQKEADHFNAFYGPNGQPQTQSLEGNFIPNGTMKTAARVKAEQPAQPLLEDRSFPQLPEGNHAIYVEPEKNEQTEAHPYPGIGENIVRRRSNHPAALTHRPTISVQQFEALKARYKHAVYTPVRKRTAQDKAAVVEFNKVKAGDIKVETDSGQKRSARYLFAGENSKTANKAAQKQAKTQLNKGVDPEAVRKSTGWFVGDEGKLRYEIDDSGAALKSPKNTIVNTVSDVIDKITSGAKAKNKSYKLSSILEHPALYQAYPEAANIPVRIDESKKSNGELSTTNQRVTDFDGNSKQHKSFSIVIGPDDKLSTLLHEIQHVIQESEGFAKGGSSKQFKGASDRSYQFQVRVLGESFYDVVEGAYEHQENGTFSEKQANTQVLDAYEQLENKANQEGYSQFKSDFAAFEASGLSNHGLYQKLSGEIEARNVQTRSKLTKEQRQNLSPNETRDIQESEAITLNEAVSYPESKEGSQSSDKSVKRLSTDQQPSPTLSFDAVKTTTDRLTKHLRLRGVRINVVRRERELPSAILKQAEEEGAIGQIGAVYFDRAIHIVADKMESVAKVEEAVLHEMTHFNGDILFGKKMNVAYQKLLMKMGGTKGLKAKSKEYGFDMQPYFDTAEKLLSSGDMTIHQRNEFLMDEFLAHANGAKAYHSLPTRIKNALLEFYGSVRDILRKLGFAELAKVNDADIALLLKTLRQEKGATQSNMPHYMTVTELDQRSIIVSNIREMTGVDVDRSKFSRVSSKEQSEFNVFIDDALNGNLHNSDTFSFAETPEVLQALGASNLSINIGASVIKKAVTGKHHLTSELLNNIPDAIHDPVMVFDSATEANSLVVLTELYDLKQQPIIVAIHLDATKGHIEVNQITSIHGRERASHIKNWIDQGYLAYRHKRKSRSWLRTGRLQLPWEGVKNDLRGKIITESDLVKNSARFSRIATDQSPSDTGFAIPIETLTSSAIRKIADKFKPLKDIQNAITKSGREISEEANAYRYETLFHGKAEEDLREMTANYIEPLAKQMAAFNISQSDLDAYLYARHAAERNASVAKKRKDLPKGGSGMTDEYAAGILDDVRASGQQGQYDQLAATVYDMTKAQRDVIRHHGLEDDNVVDAWESQYQYYVPLKGYAANETESGLPKTGKGFSIGGRESKRALGRKSRAGSPSGYVIQDLTEKLIRKRKNEVAKSFLKLVEEHPNSDLWSVYTDKNPDTKIGHKKIKDPETGETKTVVEKQAIPMAMVSERYFTAKRDGKTYYIKIEDPLLMNAMKNIGPETNSFIVKTLGRVIRLMSALNTSYNPEFALSNFPRDLQTAILNLQAEQSRDDGVVKGKKIAAQTVKDVPKAMKAVYRGLRGNADLTNEWDVWFDEFLKSGAKTGYFDMKDLSEQQESIKTLIDIAKGGPKGKALQWARATTKFVDDANSAIENAVRLAAYANARKAGISQQKSASLVKDMTVNFNRRGELGTLINSVYMFANASIQGTMNFARTMTGLKGEKGDPIWSRFNTAQKISFGMMAGAYALGMLNRSVAGEDDDGENFYDKIPAHDKERNIIIMKSFYGGKEGEYHKIPLAYGYNIFHVFGTSVEAMLGGERPIGGELAKIALAAAGSFSPIGFQYSEDASTMLLKNITPTLLKPFVDINSNENFMGGSIRNENSPYGIPKPDSSLARRSTPEGYKKVAEFLNDMSGGSYYQSGYIDINPDSMRYLVSYFTGAAGNFAVNKVPDNIKRLVNGVELETHRTVFLGRVNGKVLPYADVNKFYNRKDEIGQIQTELRSLRGTEKLQFHREYRAKLNLRSLIKSTSKKLKALRERRNRVYTQDLTLKARDLRLKLIERQMKALIDRFNLRYNEAS